MKRWLSILPPFLGLAIFAWIVYRTGIDRIATALSPIEPRHLLVFPVIIVFVLIIRGLRWLVLIRTLGIPYSLWRATIVSAIGYFGAAVTPAKVGDAVRAYYLNRDTSRGLGECFLTVFIDRLMDLGTMMLLGVASVLAFSYYYTRLPTLWVILAFVLVMLAILYLSLNRQVMERLLRPLFNLIVPSRYKREVSFQMDTFYDALSAYGRHPGQTIAAVVLTIVYWGSVFLLAIAVVRVLAIDMSLRYIVLVMPLITLMEVLPISISGLGTRDAAAIYFFALVGVGSAQAVGFSLVYVLAGTYLTAAVGFVAWVFRPRRHKELGLRKPSGVPPNHSK